MKKQKTIKAWAIVGEETGKLVVVQIWRKKENAEESIMTKDEKVVRVEIKILLN